MKFNDFKFSPKLQKLYDDVGNCNKNLNIEISVVEDIEIDGALGSHKIDDETGNSLICIKKDCVNDYVISHELLHCYFYRLGYPKTRTLSQPNSCVSYFTGNLENVLMHKLIYEEQSKRGFDTSTYARIMAEEIGENVTEESNSFELQIKNSFTIVDAEFRCKDFRDLYLDRIKDKFPKGYSFANRIHSAITNSDYKTPFEYRRAMVRGLKEIDIMLKENGLPNENLNLNIAIGIVPSKRQLDLFLYQIFDVKEIEIAIDNSKERTYALISKSDNQSSYFLGVKSMKELEDILNLTFKGFYDYVHDIHAIR